MSEGGGKRARAGGAQDRTRLWRTLAAAGRKAIAEALTEEDFERLHIESDIERFLGEQVRAGRSVVVTGNAGDGKTHLLRRVKQDLESAGAVVVEDATAEMRGGDPGPILEKWREANEGGQPFPGAKAIVARVAPCRCRRPQADSPGRPCEEPALRAYGSSRRMPFLAPPAGVFRT